ncbi:FAD-binding domain-containing protein [Trametes versicolor FP-101664 SS1]|uniref:FAD-binding domain-containing protein n=1 Tax=Trametes versicolor (strain FP-101664) TaxID=717944 RepID=UPI0004623280|nr:FAD-binding domain-containing protein [Trametes versicolor FP-101664 SS1]EIW53224.1 FAD-binding domain-containing protein [Trametes versicolor FP-101664 SS1]
MLQSLATATCLAALLTSVLPIAAEPLEVRADDFTSVCKEISSAISSASAVHWPGLDLAYFTDIGHWATSSTAQSACSVEPGTTDDVAAILQILAKNKTPFAVKGAGHASNPGFSSTAGVQIAMYRFSGVTYHPEANVAEVGAGLIWDDVYSSLEPFAVNVVGGRVSGVGVAGFTLGGGYSWKTNQHGLTIDNLTGFELVLPNGTVTTVTQNTYPDLFFGLKGGFNNFGIVTKFNLTTYPQTEVWGGLITITEDQLDKVNAATVKFSQSVTDPKAQILPTYNFLLGQPGISLILFYDFPTPPAGIFDDFLAIPHFTSDVKTRPFLDLVKAAPANATGGQRAIFHTVSLLEYTDNIMAAVVNETKFWGQRLSLQTGNFISYDVEPFLPSIFSHSAEGSSAFPPSRAKGLLPLNIYYAWGLDLADDAMHDAARQSAAHLTQVVLAEGQDVADAALYGNYAIFDTPLERIYGGNLARLQALKAQYDPENVMGLAGGWKF